MSRVLDVYLHQIHAGQLIQNDSGNLSFTYNESYVAGEHLALSLSLPLQTQPFNDDRAKAFFSGLLPEDLVRHRLARFLGVSQKNPFALLEAIGGECAGALSLYPEGTKPPEAKEEDVEILDDQRLQEILELLKRRPLLAGADGLRLSLAGAQDKLAVTLKDGAIALIHGTGPTTHILKPLIEDIKDSVHNELFCMRLAGLIDIDVPHTEIRYLNKVPYFLVERYDRILGKDGQIHRLHQEDFCQALGVMPEVKYEAEGGPTLSQCQDVLKKHSIRPAVDQLRLLRVIIFNYLIGNADAHAKNFSLLYERVNTGTDRKKPFLAPAYDLLSTAVYPDLSVKMAMKIGGKYKAEDVFLRHWQQLVPDTRVAKRNLETQLKTITKLCLEKAILLREELKSTGIQSSVFEEIYSVIAQQAARISREA